MKWFKKNRFNIFTYLFCAFSMALLFIVSFSCKTYAYTIDSNGNLIGDNLLNVEDYISKSNETSISNGTIYFENGQNTYVSIWLNTYLNNNYVADIGSTYQSGYKSFTFTKDNTFNQLRVVLGGDRNDYFILYNIDYLINDKQYTISFECTLHIGQEQTTIIKLMLNEGNEAQEWEPYGIWYSETNYDLLDSQVNLLKYGWLYYIDELDLNITNDFVKGFTFSELLSSGFISSTATFDLYHLSLYQNPNYSYIDIDIYFSDNLNNHNWFTFNLFEFSTKLLFNGVVSITDTDNNNATFNIVDVDTINYDKILQSNKDFNGQIENIHISFSSPDNATLVYTNAYYSLGFQNGVSQSYTIYQPQIDSLTEQVNSLSHSNQILQDNLNNLQHSFNTLQVAYNDLNTSYQNMLNGNNFANLFFTIAETPFSSFKQIWSVDFLGVNLAGFVTGILFIGVLIWVVKKIF